MDSEYVLMIEKVRFIEELDKLKLPKSEYIIAGSAWLALYNIRPNRDLDLIVSTKLMDERWNRIIPGFIENTHLDIQGGCASHVYITMFNVIDIDDLVYNYRVMIDSYPFIQKRFYEKLKGITIEGVLE